MSVKVSDRNESCIQFLQTARDLEVYTTKSVRAQYVDMLTDI